MRGFIAYHALADRARFVDQICVARAHRRQGVGSALLRQLADGPLELHVERANRAAIAFYTAHGFVPSQEGAYVHDLDEATEMCMRRRAATAAHAPRHEDVRSYTWSEIGNSKRAQLLRWVMEAHGVSEADARDTLTGVEGIQFVEIASRPTR